MLPTTRAIGDLLRDWRIQRRLSQLDLALEAEISPRHLSFLETGRAHPSREMVLRLAETLDVPLRERNALLHAAGYAAVYPERSLDDPALAPARAAVDLLLRAHEPYPALAVDRYWTLVSANRIVPLMLQECAGTLLAPPVNVMRLTLHPDGLSPRIANFTEWRTHLLDRLRAQVKTTGDPRLRELLDELRQYPSPPSDDDERLRDYAGVVVPFELRTPVGLLAFFSTTTVIGTPVDITLAELAIESFFPANEVTARALQTIASSVGS